jgi:ABC-type uncharacterized transport system substrate-binding protein
MLELRWVEGRDYVIDARYADGVAQVAPGLAAELVATQPDLLLANAEQGVRPLAQRTKTIPIVFAVAKIRSGPDSWRACGGPAAT